MKIKLNNATLIKKAINRGLTAAIKDHGPIGFDKRRSATKRIYGELKTMTHNKIQIERKTKTNDESNLLHLPHGGGKEERRRR
jgi:hypothetical protein